MRALRVSVSLLVWEVVRLRKLGVAGVVVLGWVVGCGSGDQPRGATVEPLSRSSSAIQGGIADSTDQFAVGVVQFAPQGGIAYCSGVLLAPNLVATARHCVASVSSSAIDCATSVFSSALPATALSVTPDPTITQSSNFIKVIAGDGGPDGVVVPTPTGVCGNDIALLILDRSIQLPQYVIPTINPPMTDHQAYTTAVTAIGYGVNTPTDTNGASAGIRRIKENINLVCIPNDKTPADCYSDPNLRSVISPNEFEGGDGTCEGDSGSGAFDQGSFNGGKWVAFGVLSRGGVNADAGLCLGSIYTRFDAWGSLLIGAAARAAAIGGYPPPSWTGLAPVQSIDASSPEAASMESGPAANACSPNGTSCGQDGDCCSVNCISHDGKTGSCTACDPNNACNGGYGCRQGVCVLGATSDYGTPSQDAGVSGGVRAGAMCDVGALAPESSASWRVIAVAMATAAGIGLGRRRRRAG
jgi:Trypsin